MNNELFKADKLELDNAFKILDPKNTEKVKIDDLYKLMLKLKCPFNPEVLKDIVKEAKNNGWDTVDKNMFQ